MPKGLALLDAADGGRRGAAGAGAAGPGRAAARAGTCRRCCPAWSARSGARPDRRVGGRGGAGGLAARLAGLPAAEQDAAVREIVLAQAALVLGMAGPDAVDAVPVLP